MVAAQLSNIREGPSKLEASKLEGKRTIVL